MQRVCKEYAQEYATPTAATTRTRIPATPTATLTRSHCERGNIAKQKLHLYIRMDPENQTQPDCSAGMKHDTLETCAGKNGSQTTTSVDETSRRLLEAAVRAMHPEYSQRSISSNVQKKTLLRVDCARAWIALLHEQMRQPQSKQRLFCRHAERHLSEMFLAQSRRKL